MAGMVPILQLRHLRTVLAVCIACAPAWSQQATQPSAAKSKVVIVPMHGPLYYRMAISEISKVVRAVSVQKPDAIVFVVSSPGGHRDVALGLAEQIADISASKTVALISGDYNGAFGHAVFPLLACSRVFLAPDNTIDLQSMVATRSTEAEAPETPLSTHQVSLLQSWAGQHRLAWGPIKQWLEAAELLEQDAQAVASSPTSRPSTRPAKLPGLQALRAEQVADLDEVLAKLGLTDAWVLNWPDPVARSNDEMQRIFQVADDLVKRTNGAIGVAREADPRAQRYELRDISRQYTVGTFVTTTRPIDVTRVYQQTDTITDHDLFADGGEAWRANTDRCIAHVRKAIGSNRQLARLAGMYPELDLDLQELNESYQTLAGWLSQLRAERNIRRPP